MAEKRENWGSGIGFVLAAAGSAIGLGNIWKFPYVTGTNGGGAFVLVYLLVLVLLGIPVMLCEIVIGRRTGSSPVSAMGKLRPGRSALADIIGGMMILLAAGLCLAGNAPTGLIAALAGGALLLWGFNAVGVATVIGGLLILSYYSVIGAWIIDYIVKAFSGELNYTSIPESVAAFEKTTSEPLRVILFHLVFMGLCAAMLWGGIRKGIERWSKVLMPLLFLLLIAVIVRSLTLPGAGRGVRFFLNPDFSRITAESVLEATGLVFYSLSLAMGITVTYGSYLSPRQNIFKAAVSIVSLDCLAAIMAGLAIFPAVFAMDHTPAAGPALIFHILPVTFQQFPGGTGWLWAGLFFVMLTIAAMTSGASLLEIGVTALCDKFRMNRKAAILLCAAATGALGCLSAVSSGDWQKLPWLHRAVERFFGPGSARGCFLDCLDYITSNWMLPLCGVLICLFVGWVWGARKAARELRRGTGGFADVNLFVLGAGLRKDPVCRGAGGLTVMTIWGLLVRFLAPAMIFVIFLNAVGVNLGLQS